MPPPPLPNSRSTATFRNIASPPPTMARGRPESPSALAERIVRRPTDEGEGRKIGGRAFFFGHRCPVRPISHHHLQTSSSDDRVETIIDPAAGSESGGAPLPLGILESTS